MHSPQHRTASVVSFLSIPQAPLIQSVTTQALPNAFPAACFIFCGEFTPLKKSSFGFDRNGFFLQKDSKIYLKRQIQQGLFELKRMIDKKMFTKITAIK